LVLIIKGVNLDEGYGAIIRGQTQAVNMKGRLRRLPEA